MRARRRGGTASARAAARESYLRRRRDHRRRAATRRRGDPSRLRLPLRERGLRRGLRRGRASSSSARRRRRSRRWATRPRRKALMEQGRRAGRAGLPRREPGRRRCCSARPTQIGFPVLIKAAAGGGGKGMRIVREARRASQPRSPSRSARRRPRSATTACCSRSYVERPRHIEFQVFGDTHGNVVHLVRARVLDPAPPPEGARGNALARPRRADARRAWARRRSPRRTPSTTSTRARSSSSSARTATFYFMEMNTRLQVEHPVTEMITGLDLVEVAAARRRRRAAAAEAGEISHARPRDRGAPLRRGSGQGLPAVDRARIGTCARRAERPRAERPHRLRRARGRRDHAHYDPMIAKLIVWGDDRADALGRMRAALARLRDRRREDQPRIPRALVAGTARSSSGDLDTGLIERHRAELMPARFRAPATKQLAPAALAELLAEEARPRTRALRATRIRRGTRRRLAAEPGLASTNWSFGEGERSTGGGGLHERRIGDCRRA